jgi:prophage regulatory protein
MRASPSTGAIGESRGSVELTVERATKAACLLKEALALLGGEAERAASLAHVRRESDRLLRLPEVQRLTGLRRSAIYEQMQRGIFPRSIKAGPRAAAWSEAAVQAWIARRIDAGST